MNAQDSFDLPPDYFAQLPRDLRLDVSMISFCDFEQNPVLIRQELFDCIEWNSKFVVMLLV